MSAGVEVRVGQVWEHPLDASHWEVMRTDPTSTKMLSEAGTGWLWVSTDGLTNSWRLLEPREKEKP